MGRTRRILASNTYYHVFNRANNRRSINLSEQTFDFFIHLLNEIKSRYGICFFSYCLMKNHFHLLLKTNTPNLSEAMKYFGEHYARHINKITNGSGPVFETRYKAKIIQDEKYFLQVLRYIHLNPVEAGVTKTFSNFQWSSAGEYLRGHPNIVEKKEILGRFLSLDDFISYHEMGNTAEIKEFYSRKQIPTILVSEVFEKSGNLR